MLWCQGGKAACGRQQALDEGLGEVLQQHLVTSCFGQVFLMSVT